MQGLYPNHEHIHLVLSQFKFYSLVIGYPMEGILTCDDIKTTNIELTLSVTISVTLILFIYYFTIEAHDGNIYGTMGRSQWMPPVE